MKAGKCLINLYHWKYQTSNWFSMYLLWVVINDENSMIEFDVCVHVSSGRTNTIVRVDQDPLSLSLGKTLPWLKVTEPLLSLNFLLKPCSPLMTLASTLHLGAEKHSLKFFRTFCSRSFYFQAKSKFTFFETVSCSWSSELMASLPTRASGR